MTHVGEQQTAVSVAVFWPNYDCVEHTEYNAEQQRRGIIPQGWFEVFFLQ